MPSRKNPVAVQAALAVAMPPIRTASPKIIEEQREAVLEYVIVNIFIFSLIAALLEVREEALRTTED
jgi:hypothetical protein